MEKYKLNEAIIKDNLKTEYIGRDLYFFKKTTSTFDEAEKLELKNGTVICASKQTKGKGRLQRNWESKNGGIYFSVILDHSLYTESPQTMTMICAAAVLKAINEFIPCSIKWPNDILSESKKKLCGILSKVKSSASNFGYINIGVGINANNDFSIDSLPYATSIKNECKKNINENLLLADCLYEIEKCLENTENAKKIFIENCLTLNKEITVLYTASSKEETLFCTSVCDDGSLLARKNDGTFIKINSGEVSLKGVYGK